ncbi:MAG: hypothetical protein AB7U79_04850 [Candidatus Izemoplasmatales bacterium]
MKKYLKILLAVITIFITFGLSVSSIMAENQITLYFFYDDACVHCYQEGLVLDNIESNYDNVVIHRYEITSDAGNADLFENVKAIFDNEGVLAPYLVIGGVALSGFNDQIESDIYTMIDYYQNNEMVDVVAKYLQNEDILATDILNIEDFRSSQVTLPILGTVNLDELSLGIAAVVIGFVDGFNPCAMWVLIFLITLLIREKNRKKMWFLGVAFLLTSAVMYFLVMAAWLNIAIQISTVIWIRIIIGLFAIGFGLYHLIKYIQSLKKKDIGCEVTTENQKIKILEKVKKVVLEKSIWIALIGIMALAVSVNLVELACSAGLPLLYTQILAYNHLPMASYYGYIGLYILFFLIDDIVVFVIAMITFEATGISNKYSRISTVVGAIIMLVIGVLLIFFPNIIMFNL